MKKQVITLCTGAALSLAGIIGAVKAYPGYADETNKNMYAYMLMISVIGLMLFLTGIVTLLRTDKARTGGQDAATAPDGVQTVSGSGTTTKKLAQAGLLAALCYIGFAFFKIDIPVGVEKTAFHFGNVFCVLAALLLGGYWGGMAGAVGMTIADLTTSYATSAPKTFILKLCIGLIVGLVADKCFHLNEPHDGKYIARAAVISSAAGMAFNVVFDPLVGYFYKTYLLGVPQDISATLAKIGTVTTAVNAVVAVIFASIFYIALRPALKKAGLLG